MPPATASTSFPDELSVRVVKAGKQGRAVAAIVNLDRDAMRPRRQLNGNVGLIRPGLLPRGPAAISFAPIDPDDERIAGTEQQAGSHRGASGHGRRAVDVPA